MTRQAAPTCNDCYFRRAGLCALAAETPCPTFRLASRGSMTPPQQPRLVPRPVYAEQVAASAVA